jgi:hypothetical protein
MRKVIPISSAVAAILAGSTAMATNVDVYISGASAQKNFWYQDLQNIADCSTPLVGAKWNGPATAPFTKAADMSFVSCTAGATPLNSNIPTGATVTFHYSAELGSVWGVADMLGQSGVSGYPSTHIFLTANQGCTAGAYTASNASFAATCGNSSSPNYALYSPGNGANTGTDQFVGLTSTGSTTMFITVQPDIMVADLEPAQFTIANNWATGNCNATTDTCTGANAGLYTAIGSVPSTTAVGNIAPAYMNGEVFGIIVYPPAGDTALNNLSSTSVAAILQGDYTKWSEVPEVGTKDSGTAITLCRRDHGSGSQVAASLFFTGQECGLFNDGGVENQGAAHVTLNGATSAMRSCVNGTQGAIGYLSLYGNLPGQNEADSYVVMNIDGVQPNSHNAAAGYYKFSTMTWGLLNPNDSSTSVAQTMLTRAQTAADILAAVGGESVTLGSNGQFSLTTANTEIGYYSVTGIVDTGSASALNNVSSASVPVSLRNNEGNSCTVMAGQNTN